MSWNNKPQVKKGNWAEQIVVSFLEKKGYVVYRPITEKAHGFDTLAVKNKKQAIVVEVKAKAKRNYYPDTGINIKHYDEYKYISKRHNLPIFIFFVDEMLKQIYGNILSELEKDSLVLTESKTISYPLTQNGIIYFPLKHMVVIHKLKEQDVEHLRNHSTRNYDYIE